MANESEKAELMALFGKPPESVIKFFESKTEKSVKQKPPKDDQYSHWNWSDTLRHAHDRVFVVSKATSLDIVKDIKAELLKCIKEGLPYQDFANGIIPTLKEKGWWGEKELVNPETGEPYDVNINQRRLKTIYQTNVKTAYAAGHYEEMKEAADVAPYWRYIAIPQGPRNKHPRADHQILHNLVFRHDDPFWETHYPPNGWGCHCRVEALSKKSVEKLYGKKIDEVVKESSPENFVKQIVEIQGNKVEMTGYKIGNKISFPTAGWDYAPGSYTLQYQRLLENKLLKMPEQEAKAELLRQLSQNLKDDFKKVVEMIPIVKLNKGDYFAVGMLPESIVTKLNTMNDKHGVRLNVTSCILSAEDRAISHALRPDHNGAPKEIVQRIPEEIESWLPTYTSDDGLVFYSPESFDGTVKTKKGLYKGKCRYKIVFNREHRASDKIVFKTAQVIPSEAYHEKDLLE